MSETGGRAAGEGGHNPKGAVDVAAARYRWSHIPGEPDALQGASPVRRGTVGKGSGAFLIPRWRSTRVVDVVRCFPPTRLGPLGIGASHLNVDHHLDSPWTPETTHLPELAPQLPVRPFQQYQIAHEPTNAFSLAARTCSPAVCYSLASSHPRDAQRDTSKQAEK